MDNMNAWLHLCASNEKGAADSVAPSLLPPTCKAAKHFNRQFIQLIAAFGFTFSLSSESLAVDYPMQPVRVVVGFAAGSTADIFARLVGQSLSERLGQPVVVENKPGAGTNIATEAVVRAPADGYTLLLTTPSAAINATLYEKLNFNFIQDMAPVASIAQAPLVMEINPSVPPKTVPDFIAYAKANPGKFTMVSGGNGSASHVSGELFKMMARVNMVHVPYRGDAPALIDLLSGQAQVMFALMPSSINYIKADKLRPLAVTTMTRSDALPEIPALDEYVRGYEASPWAGIAVRKGTSAEIIKKLNKEINAALADSRIKVRFVELGAIVFAGSSADFEKFIADETNKWGKVVKFSGAKAD